MKKILIYIVSTISIIVIGLFALVQFILQDHEFGGEPLEERAELLKSSTHFKGKHFHNTVEERYSDILVNIKDLFGDQKRTPPTPFPLVKPVYNETIASGLRAVWFGHASVLIEIDGYRVFFDPMLSEYASPVNVFAPKRMNPISLSLNKIPRIDAVVISHDHYYHLDMKTIQHLQNQGAMFFVGLGVGADLEKWGIPNEKVNEMDWVDSIKLKRLTFNCIEARHYSGKKSMSKNTLWAS